MHRIPAAATLLALAMLLSIAPRPAGACSCTNQLTLQQEFDAAWMVFSGRVLDVQPDPYGNRMVLLEPLERWKGPLGYTVALMTPLNEAICGFPFTPGEEYLVFAGMTPYGVSMSPTPWTHLCARTSLLAGNPFVGSLPPPLLPTPGSRSSWGALKIRHR